MNALSGADTCMCPDCRQMRAVRAIRPMHCVRHLLFVVVLGLVVLTLWAFDPSDTPS